MKKLFTLKAFKILLMPILLSSLAYFGFKTYEEAKKYETYTTQIATVCDVESLANERIDAFTEIISLGLVKNEAKVILEELRVKQINTKEQSQHFLYRFLLSLALLIIFSFSCHVRTAAMFLSFATFISLIYGLLNPILMVTIHKEVEYLGDVILAFESKGIIGSITKLYSSGEFAVSFTILLFSILLPVAKSLSLTFMLIFHQSPWNRKLVTFFKQIGKWSMLDVFVVATFLVYFTSNTGGITKAEIQVGLYFFLIYVLLSMITAILTQRVLNKIQIKAPTLPSSHPYDLKKL
ncbi:MAG: conserved protein of unknown function; putative membrane protein [uncultured Sulfurovum sp.]|uniref:Paraquat-inducible protein A n=1 Tax=uncultured Sulfurovum sp. TaxID=269237 RepID=A0A6S6UBC2_9BACT|nr:MAG: conserved protein of unknown function; putative membrane protein [uncultured Sulfurovum sp.]